jgi:hypothetical protein
LIRNITQHIPDAEGVLCSKLPIQQLNAGVLCSFLILIRNECSIHATIFSSALSVWQRGASFRIYKSTAQASAKENFHLSIQKGVLCCWVVWEQDVMQTVKIRHTS